MRPAARVRPRISVSRSSRSAWRGTASSHAESSSARPTVDSVFNYPTLAEAYKIAALNAANKLCAISV
jgi:hypothetical protein